MACSPRQAISAGPLHECAFGSCIAAIVAGRRSLRRPAFERTITSAPTPKRSEPFISPHRPTVPSLRTLAFVAVSVRTPVDTPRTESYKRFAHRTTATLPLSQYATPQDPVSLPGNRRYDLLQSCEPPLPCSVQNQQLPQFGEPKKWTKIAQSSAPLRHLSPLRNERTLFSGSLCVPQKISYTCKWSQS